MIPLLSAAVTVANLALAAAASKAASMAARHCSLPSVVTALIRFLCSLCSSGGAAAVAVLVKEQRETASVKSRLGVAPVVCLSSPHLGSTSTCL